MKFLVEKNRVVQARVIKLGGVLYTSSELEERKAETELTSSGKIIHTTVLSLTGDTGYASGVSQLSMYNANVKCTRVFTNQNRLRRMCINLVYK